MAAGASTVWERVRTFARGLFVREMIGRYVVGEAQTTVYKSRARVKTIDQTIPDYEFWDKLRRCKASGYSLGGLFCKRIEAIFAAWVLGGGVTVSLREGGDPESDTDPRNATDAALAGFLGDNRATLLTLYRDHLGLGDQFVIVNADATLSVPSPDTVSVERDDLDYRRVLAVEVQTRTGEYTITDRYEPTRRVVTVQKGTVVQSETVYQNLIGRLPVVHIAHGRTANETNGHSIHEELRTLYDQYDDLIFKQLDGAKLLGNPLLAFVGLEDTKQVYDANKPSEIDTYTDKDGNETDRPQIKIDQDSVLLVGKGGDAKFVAPPVGFTEDTKTALKSLFLLLLDHTGIPEFVWGGEMGSSRASTETQLDQWVREVEGRQVDAQGWLVELCEIWLLTRALTDPAIVVDALGVEWAPLVAEDEELRLKRVQFAKLANLLTDKTALELLALVEDAAAEVEDAQAEAEERREELFPEGDTAAFQARLGEGDEGEGEE